MHELGEAGGIEWIEPEQRRSAAQWRVHLEERVLRRRPDQRERAVLHGGQERVLLGLVEPVDLVEEQDRAPLVLAEPTPGPLDDVANVLDPGRHRRELFEFLLRAPGHRERQCRLAGSGRAPEQHGRQRIVLDELPQRPTRPEQMRLADDVVDRAWPEPSRERRLSRQPLLGCTSEQIVGHRSGRQSALAPSTRS